MTGALSTQGSTSQATRIEQARAATEVLAAVEAAKRWPRDEDRAEKRMQATCKRQVVADRAFWAFPRAGERLTGPTIHLAVTLAGIWGNVQYGVVELDRRRSESEMLAVAWELESNVRATTTFIVPHIRDTQKGPRMLTDLRDVYENNANLGARRVREMIFRVLPDWYTDTAQDICRSIVERADVPIDQQRLEVARELAALGVTREQVAIRTGREWDETTPGDLANLRIIAKTIKRGEATIREQFAPPTPVQSVSTPDAPTKEELTGGLVVTDLPGVVTVAGEPGAEENAVEDAQPVGPTETPADAPAAESTDAPESASPLTEQAAVRPPRKARMNRLFALLAETGVIDDDRHAFVSGVLDRDVTSFRSLEAEEVERLITYLEKTANEEEK